MTRVVVDGIIFQKDAYGGIARIFREILPRMCELEPNLQVTLFIDGPLQGELPRHSQIKVQNAPEVKRNIRIGGMWGKLLYPFRRAASHTWHLIRRHWLNIPCGAIWHSTYYTLPGPWEGPQMVTVYDMIHERFREMYDSPLEEVGRENKRRCVTRADAVICISETTRRDIERMYGEIKGEVYVIPIGCGPEFRLLGPMEIDHALLPQEPYILYVGNRAGYKNFSGLIEAYHSWTRREDVSIVAVGPPWTSGERGRLEHLGLLNRVHLRSKVDDYTLCQLYNRAEAYITPSLYEGFGLPLLEALACGCPLVAARIPTTEDIVGDLPFYFNPDDVASLHAALERALEAGREPTRVAKGIERAAQFTWDRTARETLDIYCSLLK